MVKKFLSILLALVLALGLLPTAGAVAVSTNPTFSDMPDNWATEALEYAVEKGWLNGYDDGTIKPENLSTRAEMATIVVRAFGYTEEGDISGYTDIKEGDWYYSSIAKAYKMDIMHGYEGLMRPNDYITREEAFAVLARALKMEPASTMTKTFEDSGDISDWAKSEIYAMVNAGYVQDSGDEKLNPLANIKRNEFAQVMFNLNELISDHVEDAAAAKSVDALIAALPEAGTVKSTDKTMIEETRAAYDALTAEQQELVENLEKLEVAEAELEEIYSPPSGGGDHILVSAININKSTTTLVEGTTETLTVTFTPTNASNKTITWTTSDASKATIDSTGKVRAVSAGTATITAKSNNGKTATCVVTVTTTVVPVSAITVNPTTMDLTVGGASKTIVATVKPADATNKSVTWTSSNIAVATVADGVVTPKTVGTTTITAKTVDGGFAKTILVTVTAAPVTVTGVAIETAPTKVTYTEGEALDLTGLVVTLTKSDTTTEDVAFADFSSKGLTTDKANGAILGVGDTKVTISVNGKTVDQAITVTAAPVTVTGVAIETAPTKVTYTEGEALDLTGLVVTLTKSDTTTEDVAFADFSSKGLTTDKANGAILGVGDTKVTISVNGKTVDQAITVTAAPVTVTGVTIKTPPTKVTYTEGEALDLTGLVVTLTKSDTTTEDVAFADFSSKGLTTDKANGAILGVGDTKVTISVNGKTVDQAITVTAAPVTVTGVTIKTPPTKVTYTEGEALDLTGLVVTLTKSDTTTEDVAFADFSSKGITTDKANGAILGVGDTKVTISVNGKTVDQAITVTAAPVTVTGVTIKTPPTKVTYTEGEALDLTGLVVTLTKSDTTTEDVAFADFSSKGLTTDKANGAILGVGDTKVTISVNGKTVDQAITVTAAPVTVTGVTIKTPPTKVTYTEGEALDLTGLVVTLTKSDTTTEDVAFADFSSKGITTDKANGTVLGIGDTKVTISVNGQTVDQAITVTAAPVTVTGVAIETAPTKVTYTEGEALDLTGLVVTLTKSDSSTEDVAFADFGSKGITTDKANGAILGVGDTKVTISVNGQTVDQAITVTAAPPAYLSTNTLANPTVTVVNGTSEVDAKAALDATVGVVGTKGETGTANIAWTIASYDGNTANNYTATGVLTLPTGWTGTVADVTATVTVNPVTPPAYASTKALTNATVTVANGTSEADAKAALDKTVEVVGTKGETGTANIAWTIASYDGNTANNYTATGVLTLPTGWTGTVADVTATVTVNPVTPPAYASTKALTNATVTVANGTSEADAKAALDKTVEVVGTKGETGTANIAWTIASYNGSTAGDYTATGVLTLPTGWTGTAGNVTATVTVEAPADTIPPVITLLGNATVNIANGASYTDAGATALDDVDGDITSEIVVGGDTVNTSTAGTYVITYNVSDAAGNAAVEVKRTVVVAAATDTKITLAAIPGITIPVTGAIPNVTVIDTTQYTGTIAWSLDGATFDTPFAAEKSYTATITLEAKPNYTLAGVTENFFKVTGATTTNAENDGVVTAVFSTTGTVEKNIKIVGTDDTEYTLNNLPKGLSWDGSILTMNNFKGKYIHRGSNADDLDKITINLVGNENKLTAGNREALLFGSGITIQGTGKLTLESKHPKDSVGGNMTIQEDAKVTINIDKSTERAVSGNVTVKGTGKLEVNTVGKNTVRSSVRVANRIYLEGYGSIKVDLTNEISTESDARIASDIPYIHGKAVRENFEHLYYEKAAYKVVGEWSAIRGTHPQEYDAIKLTYTVPNSVDKLYTSGDGNVNSDAYMKMIQQDSIVSAVTMYNGESFTSGTTTSIDLSTDQDNIIYVRANITEGGSTEEKYYIITIKRDKAGVAEISEDKEALTADSIRGANVDLDNIKVALKNPLPSKGSVKNSNITWESDKPEVVSNDGQTITRPNIGEGSKTVRLTATLTRDGLTETKDFLLTVLELEPSTIEFANAGPITKIFGDPAFTNGVSGDGAGAITYSSENIGVATVDSSSGKVTIVGIGTTVITASKAATTSHATVTNSYTLTVNAKALEGIDPISGTAKVGETLNAGSVTPSEATFNYQWLICDTAGGTYANIDGATNKTYTILAENANKFIKVAVTGTGNYSETVTSDATVAVANAEQAAPTGLEGVAPTSTANSDGKITGTTAGMEYKLSSESDWTPATETEITGLAAGEYLVRVKAKTGYNASPATSVTLNEYIASTDASLSDLTVDGTPIIGFDASTLIYNVELAIGTTAVPTVEATVNDTGKATVAVTDASSLPGTTTVVVTAEDGTTTKTYTINFTVAVDKTALITAISGANTNKETVVLSTDGKDVDPANKWVTEAEMTAYTSAIATAQGVADEAEATQTEVDNAVAALATATSTFDSAKKAGGESSLASFEPVAFTQTGDVAHGNVQYTNAAAVIAALPTIIEVTLENGLKVNVPVTWEDTDTYNAGAAGDYTFTAVWGDMPAGANNNNSLAVPTVEVTVEDRAKITNVEATSTIEAPVYDGMIVNPTFTITEGSPAHLDSSKYWQKKIAGSWEDVTSGNFTEGTWRFRCQVRIDDKVFDGNDGTTHKLASPLKVTVGEEVWLENGSPSVSDTNSYSFVRSKEYVVTAPEGTELTFNMPSYSVPLTTVNNAIAPYSVASFAEGGKKPYKFSKTSGPEWINVSEAGEISGTPVTAGTNSDLIIRVTDNADAHKEITINVGKTVINPSYRIDVTNVVATSTIEAPVYGADVKEGRPTFEVTEGSPAYFNVDDGNGWWQKKNGDNWDTKQSGEFTEGTWRFRCQVRISEKVFDGMDGTTHKLAYPLKVTVGEDVWLENGTPTVGDTYSYDWVYSPEYEVTIPAYKSTNALANTSVTVANGTSEEAAIAALDATVGVVGTNSETGIADITWTIASYDGNTAGDYTASGKLTLPAGWTGTAPVVTATVTVEAYVDPAAGAKEEVAKITVDALGTITVGDAKTLLEKAQALVGTGYTVSVKTADGTNISAEGIAKEAGEGTISFTVVKSDESANTADTGILNITVKAAALGGTVLIDGTLKFGEELTANVESLIGNSDISTLTYTWKRESETIGANQATYTTVEADIGKTITVEVTSSVETGTIIGTASSTIEKAAGPEAPLVESFKTFGKVEDMIMLKNYGKYFTIKVGTNMTGHEYSINDGSNWVDLNASGEEIIISGTSILIRVKETATHNPGEAAKIILTDGYVFNRNTGTIINYAGTEKDLSIPSIIDGVNVTKIDAEAFKGKGLTSVTIPETVITIGTNAFMNNNLASIVIPNSVTHIDTSAFEDNQLTEITISDSIYQIGFTVFKNNKLTEVKIPASVQVMYDNVFQNNGQSSNSGDIPGTAAEKRGKTWQLVDDATTWTVKD